MTMMRKLLILAFLSIYAVMPAVAGVKSPALHEGSFLRPLQKRDSVLIADQLMYGVLLKDVAEGTRFAFPDYSKGFSDSVEVLSPWIIDTVKVSKIKKTNHRLYDIEAKVIVTSFEEGSHELPAIAVQRILDAGRTDTLLFNPKTLNVCTIPIDTVSYKPHDIRGQIKYPVTFKELLPYIAAVWGLAYIIILIVSLIMIKRKGEIARVANEPPHISALRKLDKFRGNKFWVPEKQKIFYSGVTDALREYITARYGFGAMEMTTSEIFRELGGRDIPKELYKDLKGLFERSDFVKYAKHTVGDDENSKVLPLAVKFVTSTYQSVLDEEAKAQGEVEESVPVRKKAEIEDDSAYMPK
jgi:hypothetical protein